MSFDAQIEIDQDIESEYGRFNEDMPVWVSAKFRNISILSNFCRISSDFLIPAIQYVSDVLKYNQSRKYIH